jgi:hypothetical protein
MELQHFATELIQRINQYAGSTAVRRLRLAQTKRRCQTGRYGMP